MVMHFEGALLLLLILLLLVNMRPSLLLPETINLLKREVRWLAGSGRKGILTAAASAASAASCEW